MWDSSQTKYQTHVDLGGFSTIVPSGKSQRDAVFKLVVQWNRLGEVPRPWEVLRSKAGVPGSLRSLLWHSFLPPFHSELWWSSVQGVQEKATVR